MSLKRVSYLLERCGGDDRNFPPTDLYNEGWMLRIVLDWFFNNQIIDHELNFPEHTKWYSEALLPSPFLARYRGDKLAESWTHADGVIGNFQIGRYREGDLSLPPEAKHLVVIEAKMSSKLSSGVKNASYYNQAARNVACIAEVIRRSGTRPSSITNIGFFLIAPKSQIGEGVFTEFMSKESIENIVERRVSEYNEQEKVSWYDDWFTPALEKMNLCEISWEEIISCVLGADPDSGNQIQRFYENCLKFNQRGRNTL